MDIHEMELKVKNELGIMKDVSIDDMSPDELRNVVPKFFDGKFTTLKNSLSEYLHENIIRGLEDDFNILPTACHGCCLKDVCQGGEAFGQRETRYSFSTKFKNKSIYCEVYEDIFSKLIAALVESGMSWKKIKANLLSEKEFHA